jgi:hypothetical protein
LTRIVIEKGKNLFARGRKLPSNSKDLCFRITRLCLHRYKADEAYQVGPDDEPLKPYLDIEEIVNIAKEQGVPVGQIYKDIGGARPMFNPEGRAPIRAGVEAGKIIAGEVPKVPGAMASTALKAYRAGDIEAPTDAGMLDAAIAAFETADLKTVREQRQKSASERQATFRVRLREMWARVGVEMNAKIAASGVKNLNRHLPCASPHECLIGECIERGIMHDQVFIFCVIRQSITGEVPMPQLEHDFAILSLSTLE